MNRSSKLSSLTEKRKSLLCELKVVSTLYRRAYGRPAKRTALGLEWSAILRELRSVNSERQTVVCRPPKGLRQWATFGSIGIK